MITLEIPMTNEDRSARASGRVCDLRVERNFQLCRTAKGQENAGDPCSGRTWLCCVPSELVRFIKGVGECSMRGGEDEHLFEGGDAVADAVQGHHAQGAHALADGDLAHLAGIGAGDDELANFIAHGHGLDDGETAGVAGVFASFTTASTMERDAV